MAARKVAGLHNQHDGKFELDLGEGCSRCWHCHVGLLLLMESASQVKLRVEVLDAQLSRLRQEPQLHCPSSNAQWWK